MNIIINIIIYISVRLRIGILSSHMWIQDGCTTTRAFIFKHVKMKRKERKIARNSQLSFLSFEEGDNSDFSDLNLVTPGGVLRPSFPSWVISRERLPSFFFQLVPWRALYVSSSCVLLKRIQNSTQFHTSLHPPTEMSTAQKMETPNNFMRGTMQLGVSGA